MTQMKERIRVKTILTATVLLFHPVASFAEILMPRPGFPHLPERGCFQQIERAGYDLRQSLTHLNAVARRIEPFGRTVVETQQALRQAGAFQYQVSKTCNVAVLVRQRDQIRAALDGVRQAFRASAILSSRPEAFNAFKDMVGDWERLRDLVSDAEVGGGGGTCYVEISRITHRLSKALQHLVQLASYYEDRGQTEFTSRAAIQHLQRQTLPLLQSCGSKQRVIVERDQVRNRLDGVRQAFRASSVLSGKADAFQAFKEVVASWESFRDAISNL